MLFVCFVFHVTCSLVLMSAFDGAVISSTLHRLVWVGKNIYCGWVQGCWPSGVWWFQGSPSGVVSMQLCHLGFVLAKICLNPQLPRLLVRSVEVFGDESCWEPPVSFSLTGDGMAEGIPFGFRSGS